MALRTTYTIVDDSGEEHTLTVDFTDEECKVLEDYLAYAEQLQATSLAQASAPVTLPSHATILTGLYPPAHGALDNGVYSLPDDVPTLATLLRDRGYQTAAVVGAFVLHGEFGLDRGFDSYDDFFARQRTRVDAGEERCAAEVTASALGWLS